MSTLDRQTVALAAGVALALVRTRRGDAPAEPRTTVRHATPADYDSMVAGLRALVHERLPEGTEVLVVSRGDDRLVHLDGLHGRHFPADAAGRWAGHHPALGAAADMLSDQRGAAQALVVPATASWWFETYPELAEALSAGRMLASDPELGSIWELAPAPTPTVADSERRSGTPEYETAVTHLRELVAALVDPGDVVLVISRGDPAMVDHGAVTARHFPGDASGAYYGHPRDDGDALRLLDSARRAGAGWLVVPSDAAWWSEHYPTFWTVVHEEHTVVAHRPAAGTLIRLETLT